MMAPDDAGTGVSDNDHVRILRYGSGVAPNRTLVGTGGKEPFAGI
jgi:hypothetical protein